MEGRNVSDLVRQVRDLSGRIKDGEKIHFDLLGSFKDHIRRVLRGDFKLDYDTVRFLRRADRLFGAEQDDYLRRAGQPNLSKHRVAEAWGTQVRSAYGERHGPQDFGSIEGDMSDSYQPVQEPEAPGPYDIEGLLCPECGSVEYPIAGLCPECGSARPDNPGEEFVEPEHDPDFVYG